MAHSAEDSRLPGWRGASCRLKVDATTRDIPVIFVTAHTDEVAETFGLELGAVDFISKPINPKIVRARVKTHLTLKAQADVLRQWVYIDGLTGVHNRRNFDERLAAEWGRAARNSASIAELGTLAAPGAHIGIIATRATLTAKIFVAPLMLAGYTALLPSDDLLDTLELPRIELVKAGQAVRGGKLIEQAVQALISHGASAVLLACTETPVALDAIHSPERAQCVDTTAALARACVAWWQAN